MGGAEVEAAGSREISSGLRKARQTSPFRRRAVFRIPRIDRKVLVAIGRVALAQIVLFAAKRVFDSRLECQINQLGSRKRSGRVQDAQCTGTHRDGQIWT